MKALDLFCCGGGAAEGLMRAGFEVVGIDKDDHSESYPGTFIQGDIHNLPVNPMDFDLVWASPPCQKFSTMTSMSVAKAKDPTNNTPNFNLIPITREILKSHPWTIIENVPQAPIRADIVLTGPMFGLYRIMRKRKFELSFFVLQPPVQNRTLKSIHDSGDFLTITTNGEHGIEEKWRQLARGLSPKISKRDSMEALGITHDMTTYEIGESIPPVYAHYLALEAKKQMNNDGDGLEITEPSTLIYVDKKAIEERKEKILWRGKTPKMLTAPELRDIYRTWDDKYLLAQYRDTMYAQIRMPKEGGWKEVAVMYRELFWRLTGEEQPIGYKKSEPDGD